MVSRHAGASEGLSAIAVAVPRVVCHSVTRCHRLLQRGRTHCAEPTVVHLVGDRADRVEETLACVRTAVRGMLYADDAGVASKSADRWAC